MKFVSLFVLLLISTFVFSFNKDTLIVCSKGQDDFLKIQEAINSTPAFPDRKVYILIKPGVYFEKIKIHQCNTNLKLFGEDKLTTKIVFNDYFDKINLGRNSTFHTYTCLIEANDVLLENLTIENSAGDIGQAIALSVISSRVSIKNCNILGHQDTLYCSGEGKQIFINCFIEGTTDFIFGDATTWFENCIIFSKKASYITAASTARNQKFGFIFNKCSFKADSHLKGVYLGRPWRIFAKVMIINSFLDKHIHESGWHDWQKSDAQLASTFIEFNNKGQGAKLENRVDWIKKINKKQEKKISKSIVLAQVINPFWYEVL